MSKEDELKAFSELRGNTLLVYLCILKSSQPIGIREIQKKLEFSSPALAAYHLSKLEDLHLIEKTNKGYVLTKEVKIGALAQIVKFGSLLLPRYAFYIALISTLFILYIASALFEGSLKFDISGVSAILLGLTALLITTYECVRIWRQRLI
ncbi:MAG: hypothetical protein WHU54_06945 [Candidatus Bathyarchaeia archaeon]